MTISERHLLLDTLWSLCVNEGNHIPQLCKRIIDELNYDPNELEELKQQIKAKVDALPPEVKNIKWQQNPIFVTPEAKQFYIKVLGKKIDQQLEFRKIVSAKELHDIPKMFD